MAIFVLSMIDHCLTEIWLGLAGKRLYSRNPLAMATGRWRSRFSLFGNAFLRELITRHLMEDEFKSTRLPLFITATDILLRRAPRVFGRLNLRGDSGFDRHPGHLSSRGNLGPDVRRWRVTSGGDIGVAIAEGATTVVYIDLQPGKAAECPRYILEVVVRPFELLAADRASCAIEHRYYPAKIVHIQPGITGSRGDFSDSPRLLRDSYRMACDIWDQCYAGGEFILGHFHGPSSGKDA